MDAAARRRYYVIDASLTQSNRRGTHKRVRRISAQGFPTTRQSSPAAFMAVQRSCAAATVVNGPVCTR